MIKTCDVSNTGMDAVLSANGVSKAMQQHARLADHMTASLVGLHFC